MNSWGRFPPIDMKQDTKGSYEPAALSEDIVRGEEQPEAGMNDEVVEMREGKDNDENQNYSQKAASLVERAKCMLKKRKYTILLGVVGGVSLLYGMKRRL